MTLVIDSGIEKKVSRLAMQVADEARARFGESIPVYWFGSWVNGDAAPVSDLDIAVDVSKNTRSSEFHSFVEWVEDLPTLYRFDIVNMAEISETFRHKIILKGRLI